MRGQITVVTQDSVPIGGYFRRGDEGYEICGCANEALMRRRYITAAAAERAIRLAFEYAKRSKDFPE